MSVDRIWRWVQSRKQAIAILVFQFLRLIFAIFLLITAIYLRSPLLASLRDELFWILLALSLFLLGSAFFPARNSKRLLSVSRKIILAIAVAGFLVFMGQEIQFQLDKQAILGANPAQLERIGEHFTIGYRDFEEIKTLVEKGAIGGVFITRRNIKGKTKAEIKKEIQTLQDIRSRQELSPLWIATDQEGGIVSHLSPPLTKLPQLATVVAESENIVQQQNAAISYAETQGKELSEIGINVNFSPVVDLNKNIINPEDRFSKIYRRAISRDPEVVTNVAQWYCQTLEKYHVRCTIKHFPGLGRVEEDTHLNSATLETAIAELEQDDWVPFRSLMKNSQIFTMLGHAILTELDPDRPVSFSQPVIEELIRNQWQYDGILITDDFCMYAVYGSKDGLKNAAIAALNAGVDLILVAYDTDLYYPAMNALLKADRTGTLKRSQLTQSHRRLDREKASLFSSSAGSNQNTQFNPR